MSDPDVGQGGDPDMDDRSKTGAIVAIVVAGLCLVASIAWAALR